MNFRVTHAKEIEGNVKEDGGVSEQGPLRGGDI